MRRYVSCLLLACTVILALPPLALAQQPPTTTDPGGQVARFARADLTDLLAKAPKPADLPEDLTLRLVDYVDCTNADDPHPTLSDGRGAVRQSPVGPYRETGPAANSYFAYRFRVAEPGRAHVAVLQFPDDAERLTAIGLAQPPSGDPDKPAARVEFGYRTGDLLPLSNTMITSWTFFFPTSNEPAALLVANWHARAPAALARAWIYVVEDDTLPPAADPKIRFPRHAGRYDGDPAVLFTRFGGCPQNLIQTMDYLGLNQLGLDALRGRQFNYPSARFATGRKTIPELLPLLAEAKKQLVAVFDPDCSVGAFTMPGHNSNAADVGVSHVRLAWQNLVDWDFLKPFADKPGLAGICFGGPRGSAAFDLKSADGQTTFLASLAKLISRNHAAIRVYQNLAHATPHAHYFEAPGADWQPIGRWEGSDKPIDRCIAEHVLDYWRTYGLHEETLGNVDNLVLMRQCNRDHTAHHRFANRPVPRYWLFDAVAASPAVTDLSADAKLSGLVLATSPARRMILLAGDDFWWTWTYMAPELTPPGLRFFAPATRALAAGLEPYTLWIAGDGASAALHEHDLRRWITVFRGLPFRSFAPVENASQYPVAVRTYTHSSYHYVLMANASDVPAKVTVTFSAETAVTPFGRPIQGKHQSVTFDLPPADIAAFSVRDTVQITGATQASPALAPAIKKRLDTYAADLDAAKKAGARFAPRYDSVLNDARKALDAGNLADADRLLHPAVVREPAFRRRILIDRPRADVGRTPPITLDGKLDDWKAVTPIRVDAIGHLVCAADAANHWKGPADLSAELYLAWDPDGITFALKVTDDRPTDDENEFSTLTFSGSAYKSVSSRLGFDAAITLPRQKPVTSPTLVTVRNGPVTVHEGRIPAAQLGPRVAPAPGKTVGFNLVLADSDDRAAMPHPWSKSNLMAWSNRQDGYLVGADAQTCGEITFK